MPFRSDADRLTEITTKKLPTRICYTVFTDMRTKTEGPNPPKTLFFIESHDDRLTY